MKSLFFTQHARDAINERDLDLDWIERTVPGPAWRIADPHRPDVESRFRAIPEFGNRMLRVACYETAFATPLKGPSADAAE